MLEDSFCFGGHPTRSFSPGRHGVAAAGANTNRSFPALVVGLALLGCHLGLPLHSLLMGRDIDVFVSIELIMIAPVLLFAVDGMGILLASRMGKLCFFLLAGFAFWTLLGSTMVSPRSYRDVVTPAGHVLLMCGAASLFYRSWASILRRMPLLIILVVGSFLLWVASTIRRGDIRLLQFGSFGQTRYSVGGMLPTELALYLGIQICFLLYIWKTYRGQRMLTAVLAVVNLWVMLFIAGSRGAVVGMAFVFMLYILEGRLSRKLRGSLVAAIVVVSTMGVLWPYFQSISDSVKATLSMDEEQNSRLTLNRALIDFAVSSPWFGIGSARFVEQPVLEWPQVPHQNVLGRACESGFPAAIMYILFCLAAAKGLWMGPSPPGESLMTRRCRALVRACLWIFLYLQFRGLFCDTWTMKDIPLMVGAGLGLRYRLEACQGARTAEKRRGKRRSGWKGLTPAPSLGRSR